MSRDNIDKEIQEALDKKHSLEPKSDDEMAYRTLYEALETTPIIDYLPDSFADNVLKRVAVKPAKSNKESFWWLGSMIFFMMLTGLIVLALTMSVMNVSVEPFLLKYTPIIVLASAIIGGVQWLDKRLVRV